MVDISIETVLFLCVILEIEYKALIMFGKYHHLAVSSAFFILAVFEMGSYQVVQLALNSIGSS